MGGCVSRSKSPSTGANAARERKAHVLSRGSKVVEAVVSPPQELPPRGNLALNNEKVAVSTEPRDVGSSPPEGQDDSSEKASEVTADGDADMALTACHKRRSVKETTALFEVLESTHLVSPVSADIPENGTVSPKLLSLTSKLESLASTETGTFLPTAPVAVVDSNPIRNILRTATTKSNDASTESYTTHSETRERCASEDTDGETGSCTGSSNKDNSESAKQETQEAVQRKRTVKESTAMFEVLDKAQIISPRTFVLSDDDHVGDRVHDYTSKFQKRASLETVAILPTAPIATVEANQTNNIVRTTDHEHRDAKSDSKQSGNEETRSLSEEYNSFAISQSNPTDLAESINGSISSVSEQP